MKKLVLISAAIVLFDVVVAVGQVAQPTPETVFTFTLTAKELDAIGNALGGMPFKDAAPIINKLRDQVIAQQQKAVATPEEKK